MLQIVVCCVVVISRQWCHWQKELSDSLRVLSFCNSKGHGNWAVSILPDGSKDFWVFTSTRICWWHPLSLILECICQLLPGASNWNKQLKHIFECSLWDSELKDNFLGLASFCWPVLHVCLGFIPVLIWRITMSAWNRIVYGCELGYHRWEKVQNLGYFKYDYSQWVSWLFLHCRYKILSLYFHWNWDMFK